MAASWPAGLFRQNALLPALTNPVAKALTCTHFELRPDYDLAGRLLVAPLFSLLAGNQSFLSATFPLACESEEPHDSEETEPSALRRVLRFGLSGLYIGHLNRRQNN